MLKRITVLTLMVSFWLLLGCGQKGPLYLPPEPTIDEVSKRDTQKRDNTSERSAANDETY